MKVLSLLSQKGGSGKSTLALHLAVEASRAGCKPVALIDLDPQGSSRTWYRHRMSAEPDLMHTTAEQLSGALDLCRQDGKALAIIDTPPVHNQGTFTAALAADLVLIPTRPDLFNIDAIAATVEVVKEAGVPAAIVMNALRPRAGFLARHALSALESYRLRIAPAALTQRAAFSDALNEGSTAQEVDAASKAAKEISELWYWTARMLDHLRSGESGLPLPAQSSDWARLQASLPEPEAQDRPGTSAHSFRFTSLEGQPLPLSAYDGQALMIVNTASKCAFTPQYSGLQTLWQRYRNRGRGLAVLGVPCNDFGECEPGGKAAIRAICLAKFGVTFPLTTKVRIVGDEAHPFYEWLGETFGEAAVPSWNFHKYLISPRGEVLEMWPAEIAPESPKITKAVEGLLSEG